MILAQEKRFSKALQVLERLMQYLQRAEQNDERVDVVERELFGRLLKLGFALLESYIQRCGQGDAGKSLPRGERTVRRLEQPRERRYVSIFGEHHFRRYVYARREAQKIERIPVDERLGLPEGEFSYVLQDWLQRFCIQGSFDEGCTSLETLLGLRVSVRSAERMNQHVAEQGEPFRLQQPPPDPSEEGELLVYANDCKGVPMRRPLEERIRRGPRRVKGEKANKKQMACVGAGFSVDRFVRTPDDILDEVFRKESAAKRPQPRNKRLWAEMTRSHEGEPLSGKTLVFVQQALDLHARDPDRQKRVICLMDGEKALRTEQHEWLPRAIGVLDIWHVLERLWLVAHCFHSEGSQDAAQFVEDRLRALLEGQVGYVIGYFRRLLTSGAKRLSAAQRRAIHQAVTYFENNRQYMKYDEYLAAGYPIGSGVAEGACRHVVKDRLEMTGMRWTVKGAQSVLHLRAIYINDDWKSFQDYYIEKEQAWLYEKAAA
jgi:hypothetical protein